MATSHHVLASLPCSTVAFCCLRPDFLMRLSSRLFLRGPIRWTGSCAGLARVIAAVIAGALILPGANAVAQTISTSPAATVTALLPPAHPLLGLWQSTVAVPATPAAQAASDANNPPKTKACRETLDYRASHIRLGTSASEITRATFTVALSPSRAGFYRLSETTLASNGNADCAGDLHAASDETRVQFVQFSPRQDRFIICKDESLAACFGPFDRQR